MKKIFSFIKSLVTGFTGSLDHDQEGFSQKKVISYCFGLMIAFIHFCLWRYQFRLGNFTNLDYVLGSDLTFLAAALGLNYLHEKNISTTDSDGDTITSINETDATKK